MLSRFADVVRRVVASRVIRGAFFTLAVAFCAVAVGRQWPQARDALTQLGAYALSASFVAALASLACAMQVWRVLLGDLGSRLPVTAATRVFFVAQLSKHVPGSVWPLVAQMELGRDWACRGSAPPVLSCWRCSWPTSPECAWRSWRFRY